MLAMHYSTVDFFPGIGDKLMQNFVVSVVFCLVSRIQQRHRNVNPQKNNDTSNDIYIMVYHPIQQVIFFQRFQNGSPHKSPLQPIPRHFADIHGVRFRCIW